MTQEREHSAVVGGSTAKRVMMCPGSVALCAKVPPIPSSSYADEGTLLHNAAARCVDENAHPTAMIGMTYKDQVLTDDLVEEKLRPALNLLDDYLSEVDPSMEADFTVEVRVGFGRYLPGVFGSCDLLMRAGKRAIVLDWKFGSGVSVEAEENSQLMFYACAARRTKATKWVFDGAEEVELVIIQPPHIKRWVTTIGRLSRFERELKNAVKQSKQPDAPLKQGDHCRWCGAKVICPLMNGDADRALVTQLKDLDIQAISLALAKVELLEQWIHDLKALAHLAMEYGVAVPDWKLVDKRATRKWKDEEAARDTFEQLGLSEDDMHEVKFKSPAQIEKVLKKSKLEMPEGLVEKVSSGTTIAPADDPRPEAVLIGKQLAKALEGMV